MRGEVTKEKRTAETEESALPIICDNCGTPTIPALHSTEADGWLKALGGLTQGVSARNGILHWGHQYPRAQTLVDVCATCVEKVPALKKLYAAVVDALAKEKL